MEKYLKVVQNSALFRGIEPEEALAMLKCLDASVREYKKKQFLLRVGDEVGKLYLVLSGSVHVIKEDFWGNHSIMLKAGPSELFAEAFACRVGALSTVAVIAEEDCAVMALSVTRVLTTCTNSCEFHSRIIRNLISVMAEKNMMMNEKLSHVSQRSTRKKLLSYLSAEAVKNTGASFSIPFNRQQLADYLFVERSAMSNELGRMRDEGLIEFNKNSFTLLK